MIMAPIIAVDYLFHRGSFFLTLGGVEYTRITIRPSKRIGRRSLLSACKLLEWRRINFTTPFARTKVLSRDLNVLCSPSDFEEAVGQS